MDFDEIFKTFFSSDGEFGNFEFSFGGSGFGDIDGFDDFGSFDDLGGFNMNFDMGGLEDFNININLGGGFDDFGELDGLFDDLDLLGDFGMLDDFGGQGFGGKGAN